MLLEKLWHYLRTEPLVDAALLIRESTYPLLYKFNVAPCEGFALSTLASDSN